MYDTMKDFLVNKFEYLPSGAQLILVLDPGGMLDMGDDLIANTISWKVIRYDGNDLAFRRKYNSEIHSIVWITGSEMTASLGNIDLTTLSDIVQKSDVVIDMSILGVLQTLIPGENWPIDALESHSTKISSNLNTFIEAYRAIKPHLGSDIALNIHSIRAMVLAGLHRNLQAEDFLFKVDTPVRLLQRYITLVWAVNWSAEELDLLKSQAQEASYLALGDLEVWLRVPTKSLSKLIYFYRFLSKAKVPNIINQLRGLGLLDFDPEPLEPGLSQIMPLWDRDQIWRERIIQETEIDLDYDILRRVVGLLNLISLEQIGETLRIAETPGLCYVLVAILLELASQKNDFETLWQIWINKRPLFLTSSHKYTTLFSKGYEALGFIIDQVVFIRKRIQQEIPSGPSLNDLLKWYITEEYYSLEYAHAQAFMVLARIKENNVYQLVGKMLSDTREDLRNYLDCADHELAHRIRASWHSYINASQLSIRFLRDFIERNHFKATPKACLWFIIFDGMRYDTWYHIVKPSLLERFEIKKEQPYLSLLPTWTGIARTGLIAGKLPDTWIGYKDKFTTNQAILASKLFGIQEQQWNQKVRFYSGMESDRTSGLLDATIRYPYNILVYNISDDDLHKQRDHIGSLNENVRSAVGRILENLDHLILPEDTVVISSDHGFMELDSGFNVPVKDDRRWERYQEGGEHPVHYRFIRAEEPSNLPKEDVLTFEWKIPNGKYTVAVGRKWFQRQESPNTVRYDHGGVSFAEMVVPGVVMKLIREKKFDLIFEDLPQSKLVFDEGEEKMISISVRNRGNQSGKIELTYGLDTDIVLKTVNTVIQPSGSYVLEVPCKPVVQRGGKTTKALLLRLNFLTVEGQAKSIYTEIPIHVNERKDVVEISLGDLDNLDLLGDQ